MKYLLLLFCLILLGGVVGEPLRDEEAKAHHQHRSHHINRHFRHHKALKSRSNQMCETICDQELLYVSKWLNRTKELHFLYQIIPPQIRKAILDGVSKTNSSDTDIEITTSASDATTLAADSGKNVSLFNGLITADLGSLYDATEDFPIVNYLARLFGHFLSKANGMMEMFKLCPAFLQIWKSIIRAIGGGASRADFLWSNLKDLFGGGSFGNLFNGTNLESLFSQFQQPPIIKGFENAVQNGVDALAKGGLFQ